MNATPRIATIGDNCVDIYTNLGKTFPGGGPVNFSVQARRLGAETAYIGVIGDDLHGDWIADALTNEGVDTRHLVRSPGPTARAWVKLENGDRHFLRSDRGVREQLRVTQAIDEFIAEYDLVHTTLDGGVDDHIPRWHASGLRISYDFSHRATPAQIELLPYIDVAFFSGQFWGADSARKKLAVLHGKGASVIVITLGVGGSLAFDGKQTYSQTAVEASVVDTLGAGDAFQAAFIVTSLLTGELSEALHKGTICAAQACAYLGGFGYGRESV